MQVNPPGATLQSLKSCSVKEAAAAVAKATTCSLSKASLKERSNGLDNDGTENPEKDPFLMPLRNPSMRAACFLPPSPKGHLPCCPWFGPWYEHSELQYRNSLFWPYEVLPGWFLWDPPGTSENRLALEVFPESSFSPCDGQQGQRFSIFMEGGHISPETSRKEAAQGCVCAGASGCAPGRNPFSSFSTEVEVH